jgi:hypothetical protein
MDTRDRTMGKRAKWIGISVLLAALLVTSAAPSSAWGGRGYGGVHRFGGPRIVIGVGGPFWRPYAYPYSSPYTYPPVLVAPATPPVVAPPPPASGYYCDHPTGYYPYVQQCPGGWRLVVPPAQ